MKQMKKTPEEELDALRKPKGGATAEERQTRAERRIKLSLELMYHQVGLVEASFAIAEFAIQWIDKECPQAEEFTIFIE